jgi:hypothetical protein
MVYDLASEMPEVYATLGDFNKAKETAFDAASDSLEHNVDLTKKEALKYVKKIAQIYDPPDSDNVVMRIHPDEYVDEIFDVVKIVADAPLPDVRERSAASSPSPMRKSPTPDVRKPTPDVRKPTPDVRLQRPRRLHPSRQVQRRGLTSTPY